MATTKIRTKPEGDKTLVRILIEHPMETGRRRDETTGRVIPAHFITEVRIELNGRAVTRGRLTTGISRNPYFSFRLSRTTPGDRLRVTWVDNLGRRDDAEITLGKA